MLDHRVIPGHIWGDLEMFGNELPEARQGVCVLVLAVHKSVAKTMKIADELSERVDAVHARHLGDRRNSIVKNG